MYFLHGRPKRFFNFLKSNESILAIKYSPDFDYIACITASSLNLWSGQRKKEGHIHLIKLQIQSNGPDPLDMGITENDTIPYNKIGRLNLVQLILEDILFISMSGIAGFCQIESKLYIGTRDGYLQSWSMIKGQYQLIQNISIMNLYGFKISPKPSNAKGMGQNNPLDDLDHGQYQDTDISLEKRDRMVNHNQHPSLSASFSEQLSESTVISNIHHEEQKLDSPKLGPYWIKDICYYPDTNFMVIIFQNGLSAALIGPLDEICQLKYMTLPAKDVQCIAVSAKGKLIAFGLKTGHVDIYQSSNFQYERTLSLMPWQIKTSHTGSVQCLSWANDHLILAVGYGRRGFSIWSRHGTCLNCTISQTNIIRGVDAYEKSSLKKSPELDREKIGANHEWALSTPSKNPKALQQDKGDNQSPLEPSNHTTALPNDEYAPFGISCMAWGPENDHLLTSPNLHPNPQKRSRKSSLLEQYSLIHSHIQSNRHVHLSQPIVMKGGDYLLLLHSQINQTEHLTRKYIMFSNVFLYDNWPMKEVIMDINGKYIAVNGKRGFTIYNMVTEKWNIFRNTSEEQSIQAIHMSWFEQILVIVDDQCSSQMYQCLFFLATRELTASSMMHRIQILDHAKPIYLDIQGHCMVIMTNQHFFQYHLSISTTSKNDEVAQSWGKAASESLSISVVLIHQIQIKDHGYLSPLTVFHLLPIENESSHGEISNPLNDIQTIPVANMLQLDDNGNLSLINFKTNICHQLHQSVDQFWITCLEMAEIFTYSLWTHGNDGLQLWPSWSEEQSKLEIGPFYPTIAIDIEVVPIGFLPQLASIVGISQHMLHFPSSTIIYFACRAKIQPFLQYILQRILEKGQSPLALKLVKLYASTPHLNYALELLLYETLEKEYAQRRHSKLGDMTTKENPSLLSQTFSLLRDFDHFRYLNIVVNVARKTDPSYWKILFEQEKGAGDPKVLLEDCLKCQLVPLGVTYLRVIQMLDSRQDFCKATLKCLAQCLKVNDLKTSKHLIRLLNVNDRESDDRPMAGFELTPPLLSQNEGSEIPLKEEDMAKFTKINALDEQYQLETILSKYIQDLLLSQDIRTLAKSARIFDGHLGKCLIHQPEATKIRDLHSVLVELHAQFKIPRPIHFPIHHLLPHSQDGTDDLCDSLQDYFMIYFPSSNYFLKAKTCQLQYDQALDEDHHSDVENDVVVDSFRDLEMLLREMKAAECIEWTLVIATILFKVPLLLTLLHQFTVLWDRYKEMLALEKVKGYKELLIYVEKQLFDQDAQSEKIVPIHHSISSPCLISGQYKNELDEDHG